MELKAKQIARVELCTSDIFLPRDHSQRNCVISGNLNEFRNPCSGKARMKKKLKNAMFRFPDHIDRSCSNSIKRSSSPLSLLLGEEVKCHVGFDRVYPKNKLYRATFQKKLELIFKRIFTSLWGPHTITSHRLFCDSCGWMLVKSSPKLRSSKERLSHKSYSALSFSWGTGFQLLLEDEINRNTDWILWVDLPFERTI